MLKNYKFRMYPNKKQEIKLLEILELCRFTYNKQLELKINQYKENKINLSYFDLNHHLLQLKEEYSTLKKIHSQVLQNINRRINFTFNGFYKRIKKGETPGFPRFKSKHRYDSFTYPQSGFKLNKQMLYLSKISNLNIIKHREIEGKIKTITIKKTSTNKWFTCFSIEQKEKKNNVQTQENKVIGIDVGLHHFYANSEGKFVDNPRYLRKSELKLKRQQRKLSRKVKGSENRKKQQLKVARIHEKVQNQRKDFLHKESRKIINNYSMIVIEKLQIKNMTKNHYLAKSIHDASWKKFFQFLSYKAEDADGKVIEINPRKTSQACICGNKVEKTLAIRVHRCIQCGIEIDRDVMSAMIIKERAFKKIKIGTVGTTEIQACKRTSVEVQ